MRLIEKKCPNCGANIEFEDDAKSCKCEYCKRSFEIERDNADKNSDDPKNYKLSELPLPMKMFGTYFIGGWLISSIIIGIVGFILFIVVVALIFNGITQMW